LYLFNNQNKKLRIIMTRISVIILFFALLFYSGGFSQTIFNDFTRHKSITIEWLKPSFGEDSNTTFFTSSFFLNFHLPASENTYLVGELPFSYAKYEYENNSRFFLDESGSTIGNPYLGVEYQGTGNSRFMGEFGVRIPLASDENVATGTGLTTDFIDRAEAFAPKVVSIHAMANHLYRSEQGLSLRFRGGLLLWLYTRDTGDRTEFFLLYGLIIGYNSAAVRFHGGFNGRVLLTQGGGFSEKSLHQFIASANFGSGTVRPGFSLRIPLDEDLKEILDSTIGLDVAFHLK
jgi:hypothetical protein